METQTARVPLLDETGRFSDQFAPPSVESDRIAAGNFASIAEDEATHAIEAATEARISQQAAAESAVGAKASATESGGHRDLSAQASTRSSAAQVAAQAARDEAASIRASIQADRGTPNGIAILDASGRIPASMLPASALEYRGSWNPSTNVPALTDASGSLGDMYRVTATASRNVGSASISWTSGDYAIHNGTIWEKIDGTDEVQSVAGKKGAVTLAKADVGLGSVDNTSDANKPISTATQTALNDTVNGASVVGDDLVLVKVGGGQKNAGNVRGPQGFMGEQIPIVNLTEVSGVLDLSSYTQPRVINVTLAGAVTDILLPPHQAQSIMFELNVKQDSVGSRLLTFPSGVKFPYGFKPQLSTAASVVDQFYLESNGVDWLAKVGGLAFA